MSFDWSKHPVSVVDDQANARIQALDDTVGALASGSGGGSGGGAVARGYHHEQLAAASTWTIPHNLGFRPAGVIARDSVGIVEPADITFPDVNTCVLWWSGRAVSGSVDLS